MEPPRGREQQETARPEPRGQKEVLGAAGTGSAGREDAGKMLVCTFQPEAGAVQAWGAKGTGPHCAPGR